MVGKKETIAGRGWVVILRGVEVHGRRRTAGDQMPRDVWGMAPTVGSQQRASSRQWSAVLLGLTPGSQ